MKTIVLRKLEDIDPEMFIFPKQIGQSMRYHSDKGGEMICLIQSHVCRILYLSNDKILVECDKLTTDIITKIDNAFILDKCDNMQEYYEIMAISSFKNSMYSSHDNDSKLSATITGNITMYGSNLKELSITEHGGCPFYARVILRALVWNQQLEWIVDQIKIESSTCENTDDDDDADDDANANELDQVCYLETKELLPVPKIRIKRK